MAVCRIPLVLLACGSFNPITNQHMRLFELARDHMHSTGQYKVLGGIVSPVSDAYGKQGLVSAKHRIAMAKLALQTSDWIRVDEWESQQPDWTETVVTMRLNCPKLFLRNHRADPHMKWSVVLSPGEARARHYCSPRSFTCKAPHMYHYNRILQEYQKSTTTYMFSDDFPTATSNPSVQLKLLCGADFLDSFKTPGLWLDEHIEEVSGRYGLVCVSRGGLQPERTVHESDILSRHRHNIFLVTEWVRNEISATEVRRALRRSATVKYLIPDSVLQYIHEHNLYTQDSEKRNQGALLRPLTKQATDPVSSLDD